MNENFEENKINISSTRKQCFINNFMALQRLNKKVVRMKAVHNKEIAASAPAN